MASPSSSSPHRELLHCLVYSAVQRCRMSEAPCRLTVALKRLPDPNVSPSLRVSVSDTGVGSTLEEFLELDALARQTPTDAWDGTLSITTTGINDKAIYRYRLNLQEEISSSARCIKLDPTYKTHAKFSGTEVCLCLSNEADIDCLISWMVAFVRKIHILRAANLACELIVEQTVSAGSRDICLPQYSDDVPLSLTMPNIERLVSGLKDYTLSHGNSCDGKCEACHTNRDHLKVGTGAARNVERRRARGLIIEVVIVIAPTASESSCWMVNCSSTQSNNVTSEFGSFWRLFGYLLVFGGSIGLANKHYWQVLNFEDFIPCSISQSSFNVLMNIDWHSYGFKLKGCCMDDEGNAVLEWDNMAFARVDFAIHTYHGSEVQDWQRSQPDKYLVKKALKAALDHLKANHAGDFLSSNGQKIREYVPDLAQSIAGLILSSNDSEFRDECIALLGLGLDQAMTEGAVESCISEKMTQIIEMSDTKEKNGEDSAPYLFECEKLDEGYVLDEEGEGDEDYMVFDF